MANYKVLQDIEAEDTLIGPLTLRQCVYAGISIVGMYLSYIVIARHAPFLAIVFLPFVLGGAFFAFPWSKQQPTEVWALAKIRFFLKPRKRIWNQSGVKQLVTITAPKRVIKTYRRNLSPDEAQNRMRALAETIDSRGWAVKNSDLGYYTQAAIMGNDESDRLIDPLSMPQDVPELVTAESADIFDTTNNPVAHKFDMLMTQSADARHEQLVQQLQNGSNGPAAEPAADTQYWHMKTIEQPTHHETTGIAPDAGSAAAPTISPTNVTDITQSLNGTVTGQPDPAILGLANNNDLNVATIAREAQRSAGSDDEVVVSLHS